MTGSLVETSWPCTPPGQIQSDHIRIQQGMQRLLVPNQDNKIMSLFDQLKRGIPSQPMIIQQLKTNHELQLAGKAIQEKEILNWKKKRANKKPNSRKGIASNHWDSDVRKATKKQRAQNDEAEREKAREKMRKEQKKQRKQKVNQAQKALGKLTREAKAAKSQRKKEEALLEKIKKTKEQEEKKAQKATERALKSASCKKTDVPKVTLSTNDGTSEQELSTIEEENSQTGKIFQEETQLPLDNQLGFERQTQNNIALNVQLAKKLQSTLIIDSAASVLVPKSSPDCATRTHCSTRTHQTRLSPLRYY